MAVRIAAIYRYPVKGMSAEPMARVALAPGECLPQDRRFAIALASTRFDPTRPEWLAKTHFVMLMRDEKLAQLASRFDAQTGELTIEHAGAVAVTARLTDPEGCRVVSRVRGRLPRAGGRGSAAHCRGAGSCLCRCAEKAQCDDRQIRLADQPRQHRRARTGCGVAGRSAALPRQCLFRWVAGLERARLGRLRRSSSAARGCG